MIHEILFALLGSPSSLLHVEGQRLINLNGRIQPNEKQLIGRLLNIADSCIALNAFIEKYLHTDGTIKSKRRNGESVDCSSYYDGENSLLNAEEQNQEFDASVPDESSNHPGIYLQTFCTALDKELEPYREEIVALEAKALRDIHSVPFTAVIAVAEKYSDIFQVLNSITKQIEIQNIKGCSILDFLHRQMFSGSPRVIAAVHNLFRECHTIFIHQLSRWLLLGHRNDRYDEFFIMYNDQDIENNSLDVTTGPLLGTSGHIRLSHADQKSKNLKNAYLTSCNYSIRYGMLPSYIRPSVAEKILYVGKMIMLFREDPKNVTQIGLKVRNPKLSIWGDKEVEYFKKLKVLCDSEEIDQVLFEMTVDEIRGTIVKCTWQYFVVETKLFEEIHLIKDFFLLGRGELFLEFLYKTDALRTRPVQRIEIDRNCREAFIMAAHQVMFTDEAALNKFSIHFPFKEFAGSDVDLFSVKDGWWHILKLNYTATWPMHLIFRPIILENYNKLFNFLMRVKKAQRDLHEMWFDHKKNKDKQFSTKLSAGVWQLRNNLTFIVNNLQYYLQVDVLESQFTILQTRMKESQDFEEIIQAHTVFQANIMSQTFMSIRETRPDEKVSPDLHVTPENPMHSCLLRLLTLADRFCKIVGNLTINQNALDNVSEEYERTIAFLMMYTDRLQGHPSGVYVSQLYLRLNYNGWFTSTLDPSRY